MSVQPPSPPAHPSQQPTTIRSSGRFLNSTMGPEHPSVNPRNEYIIPPIPAKLDMDHRQNPGIVYNGLRTYSNQAPVRSAPQEYHRHLRVPIDESYGLSRQNHRARMPVPSFTHPKLNIQIPSEDASRSPPEWSADGPAIPIGPPYTPSTPFKLSYPLGSTSWRFFAPRKSASPIRYSQYFDHEAQGLPINDGAPAGGNTESIDPLRPLQGTESASDVGGDGPLQSLLFALAAQIPSLFYTLLLLGLPSVYWERARRIIEDPNLSREFLEGWLSEKLVDVDPSMSKKIEASWEQFLDSHLEEWKTLNVVSVLLCGTLLTVLQIQDVAQDPLTRWTALFSVTFALCSLTYGCVFVVHFASMRNSTSLRGWVIWILEIYNLGTNPFWNPYILLASPAIWLSWAVVMFCVIIVSFAWRTDTITAEPPEPLSPRSLLAARIMLTAFLIIGVLYFVLIVATLTQRIHKGKVGTESQPARGTPANHPPTSPRQRPARLQKKRLDGE